YKGIALNRLGRKKEESSTYNEIIQRFQNEQSPTLKKWVEIAQEKKEDILKKKTKEYLNDLKTALKTIAEKTIGMVTPIREILQEEGGSAEHVLDQLKPHLIALEIYIDAENLLTPIVKIEDDVLYEPYRSLQQYVLTLMDGEEPEESDLMMEIPQLETFKDAVEALRNTAYGKYYENGRRIEGRKTPEVAKHLRDFVKAFSNILQALVERAVENSADRIQGSFTECSRRLLEQMKDECRNVEILQEFEGLLSVFDKELNYPKPPKVKVECDYEGGVVQSVVETITVESNDDIIEIGANWLSNLFFDEAVFTKEVEREKIVLDMPALGEMLKNIYNGSGMETALNEVTTYVCVLVQEFVQQLGNMIDTGIRQYVHAINENTQKMEQYNAEEQAKL
ncbi:MAG: hypothetical protein IJ934_02565, partial [Acetobacter sp.]|nr:hypothetical protein [Acetobacter sp.]